MKKLLAALLLLTTILLAWLNLRLHTEQHTKAEQQHDILLQLNFLGKEVKTNDLGKRMQVLFPEGHVFVNALYGLAWCEFALAKAADPELRPIAIKEALFAYSQLETEEAKSVFHRILNPEYGIFYAGWKNYLLSKILQTDNSFVGHDIYEAQYKVQCALIASALAECNTPYLASYQGQAWPADMCTAMASLRNHDRIFEPKYTAVINGWLKQINSKLDPSTQMVPHKVHARTAEITEGTRGSSSSLIIRLLAEIDPAFAKEQYTLYKKHIVSTTFGLPSISEYPIGQPNEGGDVDSGPVILGVGFSGTIVAIGTAAAVGDYELSQTQYKTINAFGLGWSSEKEKKYALGYFPIADAFIAWGRATEFARNKHQEPIPSGWANRFHGLSALVLGVLWLGLYRMCRRKTKVTKS
jgi:hypothetical protein